MLFFIFYHMRNCQYAKVHIKDMIGLLEFQRDWDVMFCITLLQKLQN